MLQIWRFVKLKQVIMAHAHAFHGMSGSARLILPNALQSIKSIKDLICETDRCLECHQIEKMNHIIVLGAYYEWRVSRSLVALEIWFLSNDLSHTCSRGASTAGNHSLSKISIRNLNNQLLVDCFWILCWKCPTTWTILLVAIFFV